MQYFANDNTTYQLIKDFKHQTDIRLSFNGLTQSIYGFDLEDWYQSGEWQDQYIPYALMHEGTVVSNVSVNRIELWIDSQPKIGAQIGTVMTHPDHRHKGLSQFLLKEVIREWKDQVDFIYLFANDTVLDFYPKYGFEQIVEFQHTKPLLATEPSTNSCRKLNMNNTKEKELLIATIEAAIPISKISMRNNVSLIMFYCNSYKKDSIYYLGTHHAIVIADVEGDVLKIDDVFCADPVEIDHIIQELSQQDTKKVILGFTPFDESGYEIRPVEGADTLFILKNQIGAFDHRQWMFPVLSHA